MRETEKRNKSKANEKKRTRWGSNSVDACFLALSAALTSVCKGSEQTPMCLLRSLDCLSFLLSLLLKTRCPSSHSNHRGQETAVLLKRKTLLPNCTHDSVFAAAYKGKIQGLLGRIRVWIRVCFSSQVSLWAYGYVHMHHMSVTSESSSGACCLGTMVQPGASAPQRGLLWTTCHRR